MDHLDALNALAQQYPTIKTNGAREAHGRRRLANLANLLKSRGVTRDTAAAKLKEALPSCPSPVLADITASVLHLWPGI